MPNMHYFYKKGIFFRVITRKPLGILFNKPIAKQKELVGVSEKELHTIRRSYNALQIRFLVKMRHSISKLIWSQFIAMFCVQNSFLRHWFLSELFSANLRLHPCQRKSTEIPFCFQDIAPNTKHLISTISIKVIFFRVITRKLIGISFNKLIAKQKEAVGMSEKVLHNCRRSCNELQIPSRIYEIRRPSIYFSW